MLLAVLSIVSGLCVNAQAQDDWCAVPDSAAAYSLMSVDVERITDVKDANFINSLSGKVAGVTINQNAAGQGTASRITMRGQRKFSDSNMPLIVIDGMPMHNVYSGSQDGGIFSDRTGTDGIADINPEDIEEIRVLTGPSGAVLYGSAAANGAIIITTKKGISGKPRITFSNNTYFSTAVKTYDFQNTYGNKEWYSTSWGPKLETPSSFDPYDFFDTGINVLNNISFSGGSRHNRTYLSASSVNSRGILPTAEYNRYNVSLRNTSSFFNDRLTLDASAQIIIQDNTNLTAGGEYANPLPALFLFPRGEDFNEIKQFERWDNDRWMKTQYWPSEKFSTSIGMQNPYWILNRMTNEMDKQRYVFSAQLKYAVAEWLDVSGKARWDSYSQRSYDKRHASSNVLYTKGSSLGYYGLSDKDAHALYADVSLDFHKVFRKDWSVRANIGASCNEVYVNSVSSGGGLLNFQNAFNLSNLNTSTMSRSDVTSDYSTKSLFGHAELGWKRMIYLNLAGRKDWVASASGITQCSIMYPSAGVSFVASELFSLPSLLPYLKLRASWNNVGLVNLEASAPEYLDSWEAGFDAEMLKGKVDVSFTWYRSDASPLTSIRNAAGGVTYLEGVSFRNSGVEVTLGYKDSYLNDKISFSTNMVLDHNQNRVMSTPEVLNKLYYGTLGIGGGPEYIVSAGGSSHDLYINQDLRRTSHGYIWQDEDGDVQVKQMDQSLYIGSTLPDFHAGWNTSLSFAGINLFVQFTGRFGGIVISDTRALLDRYGVSSVSAEARDNGGVDLSLGMKADPQNYYETISTIPGTYYAYDATNIRLSELSVSYDLPRKWFKDKMGLTVGFTGKNLCMIYCKAPFDPELTTAPLSNYYQGIDYFMMPSTRNLGFNVRLTF